MSASDFIALIALAVSFLSAWSSYCTYRHTVRTREEDFQIAFLREKYEFLERVEKARKGFDCLEKIIKSLLEKVSDLPESTCKQLESDASQLCYDLKHLQGCLRQACSIWEEAYELNQRGLARQKPHFLALIEADEEFARVAQMRCDRVEELVAKVNAEIALSSI